MLRPGSPSMASPIVRTERLTRSFGSLMAVAQVDFEVERGELRSIIGPNGAGKTTFFNVIAGLYKPTSGRIVFDGTVISGRPPHRITRLGIARTFQNIRLFQNMTALENVMVGHHSRMRATPFEAVLRTPREREAQCVGPRAQAQATTPHAEPARLTSEEAA